MSAAPGAPYELELSVKATADGVVKEGGEDLLQNDDTQNNFTDFLAGNAMIWAVVRNTTDANRNGISLRSYREGRKSRTIKSFLTANSRNAPFPGFPINISQGRLQFKVVGERTARPNADDVIEVTLILAAPPAGSG